MSRLKRNSKEKNKLKFVVIFIIINLLNFQNIWAVQADSDEELIGQLKDETPKTSASIKTVVEEPKLILTEIPKQTPISTPVNRQVGNNYFEKLGFTKCKGTDGQIRYEVDKMKLASDQMSKYVSCTTKFDEKTYDKDVACKAYEQCAFSLLSKSSLDHQRLESVSAYENLNNPQFNKIVAEDYAARMLKNKLNEIESDKFYRKYAEKLGIKIPESMICENQSTSNNCNKEQIEKVFTDLQRKCQSSDSFSCHKLEDKSYTEIDLKNPNDIKADIYLDRIADNKVAFALENETNNFDTIFTALSENCTKEVDKIDCKSKKLKEVLSSLDQEHKLDLFLDNIKSKDELIKKLVTTLEKNTSLVKINKDDFRNKFNNFRAKFITSNFDNCNNKHSIKRICESTSAISSNSKNGIASMNSYELEKLFKHDDSEMNEYYSNFMASDKSNIIHNYEEFTTLVKGMRCHSILGNSASSNLDISSTAVPFISRSQVPDGKLESETVGRAPASAEENNNETETNGPKTTTVIPAQNGLKAEAKTIEPKEKDILDAGATNTIEEKVNHETISNSNNNQNNLNSNPLNPTDNRSSQTAPAITPTNDWPDTSDTTSDVNNTNIDQKIGNLNSKISNTEQSLAKVLDKNSIDPNVAFMGAAEKESEISKLRSELMRLQTELSNIKAKAATSKTNIETKAVQPNLNNNLLGNQINGAINNNSNQIAGSAAGNNPSRELNRAPAMIAPSANDLNVPAMNSSVASTIGSGGAPITPSSGGLILLKLDGLNADVASNEIVSLINKNTNSDAPIYVEEGGYVKEIVPIMKDGHLVLDGKGQAMFEKINKGKVGEFIAKNKGKANSSNPSNADLKRAEQAKVKQEEDRVKYNALKALSDKALK